MKNFFIRLRHLTWRRVVNKLIQTFQSALHSFTFRKIPHKNMELFENLRELTSSIADSNGSGYYEKADIKVGIITDEFMYNYYKDAVKLITVNHDSYRESIDNTDIDILMYVSCWRGMNNDDWYGDLRHGDVVDAVKYANERNITTIFQSIEDPVNYERYLPIAAECDYIFTTDSDCVERYRKDTGNENSFLLEYGVNPGFHNPIGINEKFRKKDLYDYGTVFFAGSWMDRYKNRCRDISLIFNGVMDCGRNLMIADRNVEVKLPGYRFPRKYSPFVVPAIEHTLLQKVHKLFDFNVNINTVQDSPTMCAMRVYELQALGCLVLSNYSLAVSENFPDMFMINNRQEAGEILSGYSREELYRMQVKGIRNVMTDKTVFDRLDYIFDKCGVNYRFGKRNVIVLCDKKSGEICRMFDSQTYENKILVEEKHFDADEHMEDFIAFMSEEYSYGENYLTDMINAFKYCDVEFVTKGNHVNSQGEDKGYEYDFTDQSGDICTTVMTCRKYLENRGLPGIFGRRGHFVTGKGFKLDSFEIEKRRENICAERELKTEDRKISVIVPVYNNGGYLEGRCFKSLMRSSVFDKMQIYLIDDGSNDTDTVKTVKRLSEEFDNVTAYFFEKGGSGSAARPRNKGVEISKEPYITYLDPDNEAINDGYAKLYEKMKKGDADMVFGAILMRATSEKLMRIGYLFKDGNIDNPRKLLISENFRSQSIQACLVKRELITGSGLKNPEGAFGEDTLFFMELMVNAGKVCYLNEAIHIYYAQRMDSSINDIGVDFFRKSLILEEYQIKRLEKYGLLDEYIERKLDYFVINWYIDKLYDVGKEEYGECVGIIADIVKLYGKNVENYASYIKETKQ